MALAKNAQAIFVEVVEKVPRDQWQQFLDQACDTDQRLRSEVQRLLKAHEDMGDFMNRPALGDEITERPGAAKIARNEQTNT
jgi:hypothetical protein